MKLSNIEALIICFYVIDFAAGALLFLAYKLG